MKFATFFKIGYMPRWMIVCMDVSLSFFAIILSYLLRFNFDTRSISKNLFTQGILITLAAYLLFFFVFRSFAEIVRHTTIHGVLKVFLATLSASLCLLMLNIFLNKSIRIVPYSVIGINFFISFFMLSASRVAIKSLFATASKIKKEPVLIFGAGAMGQAAFKTIKFDKLSNWNVIAFIDDNLAKQRKSIGGVRIFSLKDVSKILRRNSSVKRAIIAVNHISLERRNEVADFFIQKGITVSILPHNQKWMHDPFKIRRLRDIKIEDLLEREPIHINNKAISAELKNKCILITGAAGSIGSGIVKQVAAFKPKMLLLCDMAESPLHDLSLYMQENFSGVNYKLLITNITDANSMEKIFSIHKPNVVFHAAAYKHVPLMEEHPREAVINNVYGTKLLADLSVKYNATRFVMVSTDKAVNPTNVMGASKRIAEMYVQSLNGNNNRTLFITTRFGNVLDSNGSVLPRFKAQLAKGGPITVTHPEITRFFMTIPEACQLVLEAGVMGQGGEIFVFDMGESVRIKDLAEKMIRLAGLQPGEDIKIHYSGLRPGEKLYEEVLNDLETTKETYHPKIKIARIRKVNYEFINDRLNDLINCAKHDSDWHCVSHMKTIVPEFKSNNSKYETLDKQTQHEVRV